MFPDKARELVKLPVWGKRSTANTADLALVSGKCMRPVVRWR
jgi:hypothetical protein